MSKKKVYMAIDAHARNCERERGHERERRERGQALQLAFSTLLHKFFRDFLTPSRLRISSLNTFSRFP